MSSHADQEAKDPRIENDARAVAEARAVEADGGGAAARPAAGPAREPEVNKLFRMVMKYEGSDLHLKVGQPPMMRLRGDIRRMEMRPLTQEDMERLLLPNLTPKHRKILDDE